MNERVLEKARLKAKKNKEVKIRFPCIGTVACQSKVNIMFMFTFILMKTVIFICRGRNAGRADVEAYRDKQGQTRTHRDRQGQARKDRERHGQTWTNRDRQGRTGTGRDKQGQAGKKGTVPVCPCLSLFVPTLSLLVLACPCLVPGM